MSLQEVPLKASYDSDEDDILETFYNPVLAKASKYMRLAGFFSSSALAVAARGLSEFIKKGGHMQLVVSPKLNKKDVDAICTGIKKPMEVIAKIMLDELNSIEDELIKDHVQALAWMVAKRQLEIKVVIMKDKDGKPLDEKSAYNLGMFHQKVGVLEDKEGNTVSFSGSVNESANAWEGNIEEFKVFRSWIEGEVEHLRSDYHKFERYWYGQSQKVEVLDIPKAVEKELIENAPESITGLKFFGKRKSTAGKKVPPLWVHQESAIKSWLNNKCKGIFEMATGTGKTRTAIECIKELKKKVPTNVVVVVCPYSHLITQWIEKIDELGLDSFEVPGNSSNWLKDLTNEIHDVNNGYSKGFIVVTTYDTFSGNKFIKAIEQLNVPTLLVADEVHGSGSTIRRNGLLDKYEFRLGLSATPTRWFDDEGSKIIQDYFGGTVFEYGLKKAIESGCLTPYEYYPHFVELSIEELEEYIKLSKKIAIQYMASKEDRTKQEIYELLCIQRQRLIINAKNKYDELERILEEIPNVQHCLVYCSPQQINTVQEIINLKGLVQHKFTWEEDMWERERLLKRFDEGMYQILVAIKCLDEGVDVPSTRTAIILASSGNPKEYIQRRGRVLRKSVGKEKAIIHDVLVVPTIDKNVNPELWEVERKILKKELIRYKEFAEVSMNGLSSLNKINPILMKYNISMD